ncbi:hypothetical protein BGZ65_010182 [Modicella reniformis]|uniref:mRNA stability protein n=1 Tax=Modicella reniformis TaxID=1440133 RepID=A0A9P6M7S4_9FUNG|nr:hypothetical protein BGZ65_010182 [Modicella reniformis]
MSSPLNPSINSNIGTDAGATNNAKQLTDQEKKLKAMYGNRLPTVKGLINPKLKERKYFDSGDYALSKAGKTTGPVGSQHPQPENIPHSNPAAANSVHGSPPVKESSLIHESEIPEGATPTVVEHHKE